MPTADAKPMTDPNCAQPVECIEQLSESDKDVALGQAVEFAEYVERQAKGTMREAARRFLSLPYSQQIAARLAEIEALRAEVRTLRRQQASWERHIAAAGCEYVRDEDGEVLVNRRAEQLDADMEALRAEVERLQRQLRQTHKDYGCELRDPNGTIWEYAAAQKAQAERLAEALREAADMLLADYPETAKRLRALLHPTAAQEDGND